MLLFDFSPGDPHCQVIFVKSGILATHFYVCQPGEDKIITKNIVMSIGGERFRCVLECVTCFNGSLYGVECVTFSVLRANLRDSNLEFETVFHGGSMKNKLLSASNKCYLIESRGELLLVIRYNLHSDICDFQVLRADFSSLEWELLTSIGDRAIFLQNPSREGISCSASESGIQGDCIYYTEEGNRLLYVFNLEDGSFTSTLPCPTFDRKELIQHWVMIPPPTSVSGDCSKP